MSKLLKTIPLLILFVAFASIVIAQPNSPSAAGLFEEIEDIPINGAIALLTSAGIGLGIKKLYARKK
ncbi:MAG: hypothetical protein KBG11_03785 [Bacteroidia bacterium]|nr:hypothetical protein [Bacteroidia bacterium]